VARAAGRRGPGQALPRHRRSAKPQSTRRRRPASMRSCASDAIVCDGCPVGVRSEPTCGSVIELGLAVRAARGGAWRLYSRSRQVRVVPPALRLLHATSRMGRWRLGIWLSAARTWPPVEWSRAVCLRSRARSRTSCWSPSG
jgi:hypothetical protein